MQQAQNGNPSEALEIISNMRWQRALVDETFRELRKENAPQDFSDVDLSLFQEMSERARGLETILDTINEWVGSSYDAFTHDELMMSKLGIELYIERLVPDAWFFSSDIAILAGGNILSLHKVLVDRGQRKFIVLMPEEKSGLEEFLAYFAADESSLVLLIAPDLNPELGDLKALAGASWPKSALICSEPTEHELFMFEKIQGLLRSACIQTSTRRWLPQQTTIQYFQNLNALATCDSISDYRSFIADKHLLVVSPGPSLKKDLAGLKKYRAKFVVIAALKAVDTLLDSGVTPDFAIWQDPRDHSEFLPKNEGFRNIPLILSECCHKSFFEAGFSRCVVYGDPHLLRLPSTIVLHGKNPVEASAASVSTMACVLVANLGCKSITLLGQDLCITNGYYVSDSRANEASSNNEDSSANLNDATYLTCKGIDGETLETLPNYLSFIDEFKQISRVFESIELYNCTSHGAFLDGWDHITLDTRSALLDFEKDKDTTLPLPFRSKDFQQSRIDELINSCDELNHCLENWLMESSLTVEALRRAIIGSQHWDDVAQYEQRLKNSLEEECTLLRYYGAWLSQLVTDSVQCCSSIEETFQLSMDYYLSLDREARTLMRLCKSAKTSLEGYSNAK